MLKEQQRLETQIEAVKQQLSTYPEGRLVCTRNGKHYKWYHSEEKRQTYIPKKNQKLAELLAAKKYLTCLLKDLLQEKCAVDFYLRHCATDMSNTEQLLENPEYQSLLTSFFTPLSQELSTWQNSSYERNMKYPEHLTVKSITGIYVRSKSEALISRLLYTNHIPFRYECIHNFGQAIFYPDFTIRHPKTGEFYYWEHFGLMDQPEYIKKTCAKIHTYSINGIIPSINLITTYETKAHPLIPEKVEALIQQYFL